MSRHHYPSPVTPSARATIVRKVTVLAVIVAFIAIGGYIVTGTIYAAWFLLTRLGSIAFLFWLVACVPYEAVAQVIGLKAAGLKFNYVVVGPVVISSTSGQRSIRYLPYFSMYSGVTAFDPATLETAARGFTIQLQGLIGGAVLRTLVAALGGGIVYLVLDYPITWVIWSIACAFAVFNLVRFSSFYRQFSKPGIERDALVSVNMLVSESAEGRRPREFSADVMEFLADVAVRLNPPLVGSVCVLLHEYELDRQRMDSAALWIDRALAAAPSSPVPTRFTILRAAAYFTARYRRDDFAARQILNRTRNTAFDEHEWPTIEAAVAYAENDIPRARLFAEHALALVPHAIEVGLARSAKERLESLLGDIQRVEQGGEQWDGVPEAPSANPLLVAANATMAPSGGTALGLGLAVLIVVSVLAIMAYGISGARPLGPMREDAVYGSSDSVIGALLTARDLPGGWKYSDLNGAGPEYAEGSQNPCSYGFAYGQQPPSGFGLADFQHAVDGSWLYQ